MTKKCWIAYDGRGEDDGIIYEAFCEEHGDTRSSVIRSCRKDWPDCVVYEYAEQDAKGNYVNGLEVYRG